ncbi:MAG: diguanylate cyclase domain-containing protein, partial [Shewanella sp.]
SFVKIDAVHVAIERFQSLLEQYNQQHPLQPTLVSSIGVVHWSPELDINLEDLLDAADRAMYQDKAEHHSNKPE